MIHPIPQGHWRPAETLADDVEFALAGSKAWGRITALPPTADGSLRYDADLFFAFPLLVPASVRQHPVAMRGRQGTGPSTSVSITFFVGQRPICRADIGHFHRDPDNGPLHTGPHLHVATTTFPSLQRGSRSRAYQWLIDPETELVQAMLNFGHVLNILGSPTMIQHRLEGAE